jgi:hypothetical protein
MRGIMLNINDKELEIQIDKLYGVLGSLRLSNGFYKAANSGQYNYTWLRDNFYCALSELYKKPTYYQQTLQTWLDYYKDAESKYGKFSSLINKGKIDYDWEFPNPRIDLNLNEIHNQSWGHVQFDTIGYFFRGIYLGERNGLKIISLVL